MSGGLHELPIVPEVSLVSPMYNEGERIRENLEALSGALETLGRTWEIVLVNDGSTDDSFQQAAAAAAGDKRIRLVTYGNNRGRGYAIRRGLQEARGEVVVVTESDLSWGEDIILRMVSALDEEDADVVIASPHMEGGRLVNVPPGRAFLTRFGNVLLRRLMPGGHTMNTGMTRAYRRHVIDALDLESAGKEVHLEIVVKIHAMGYRVVEVPATLAWPKKRGRRKSTFRAGPLVRSHLIFGVGEYPLIVFGTIGLIELGVGVVLALHLLSLSLSGTPVAGRPLLFLSVLLILMGILVMLFSFLALQLRDLRRTLFRLQGNLETLRRGVERRGREGDAGAATARESSKDVARSAGNAEK